MFDIIFPTRDYPINSTILAYMSYTEFYLPVLYGGLSNRPTWIIDRPFDTWYYGDQKQVAQCQSSIYYSTVWQTPIIQIHMYNVV